MGTASGLSQRQESILAYIEEFVEENGISPAIRDIQSALEISSTSVVAYNLKALQEKGHLSREGKISRGIKLRKREHGFQVPLLGTITAGQPLPNPQDTSATETEMVLVPSDFPAARLKDVYALRVRGHSMIDALIDDGDTVLLRFQETAENGQMVAATIVDENAVTLKKFYHEGSRIRLQPANMTMDPIYTTPDNVRIQGRVVGVIRTLA